MSDRAAKRVFVFAILSGLLLGFFPQIDLVIVKSFYSPILNDFPLRLSLNLEFMRRVNNLLVWIIAAASIFWTVMQAVRRYKFALARQTLIFLIISMLLGPGMIVNVALKNYWGRPRPIEITEFNGSERFTPWWDPKGNCTANCSFVAGESAIAFWTIAPASLLPPRWRPYGYIIAVGFGLFSGLLRMARGAHFFSDVIFSGVFIYFIVWLVHRLVFRTTNLHSQQE
jgi:lipid A 4'-phosphatase